MEPVEQERNGFCFKRQKMGESCGLTEFLETSVRKANSGDLIDNQAGVLIGRQRFYRGITANDCSEVFHGGKYIP
jgi:hypothetical protein